MRTLKLCALIDWVLVKSEQKFRYQLIFRQPLPQSNSVMDVTTQEVTPQHMHLVVLCSDFICMQQGQQSMGLPLEGTVNSANIYDTADQPREVYLALVFVKCFVDQGYLVRAFLETQHCQFREQRGGGTLQRVCVVCLVEYFSEKALYQDLEFLIPFSRDYFGPTRKL